MLIRPPFSCLCLLWLHCIRRRVLSVLWHFEMTSLQKPSCGPCYIFDFVFCPLPGQKWHIGKALLYFKNLKLRYHRKSCHRSGCPCPTWSSPTRAVLSKKTGHLCKILCAKSLWTFPKSGRSGTTSPVSGLTWCLLALAAIWDSFLWPSRLGKITCWHFPRNNLYLKVVTKLPPPSSLCQAKPL